MQATVIAGSILGSASSKYAAKPFLVSGSCKRETVNDQEKLLRIASNALQEHQAPRNCRLYCIASDGDSRRRRALIAITLTHNLSMESKVFDILSPLPLFNTRCGKDDITSDFDWKHVFKRF